MSLNGRSNIDITDQVPSFGRDTETRFHFVENSSMLWFNLLRHIL